MSLNKFFKPTSVKSAVAQSVQLVIENTNSSVPAPLPIATTSDICDDDLPPQVSFCINIIVGRPKDNAPLRRIMIGLFYSL